MIVLSNLNNHLVGSLDPPTSPIFETDKRVIRKGCGKLRMGFRGSRAIWYRPPCGSRRCTLCQPKIIRRKIDRLPDEVDLYSVIVDRDHALALTQQLARARRRGDEGEYMRVPVGPDMVMIVSNAVVGHGVERETVEEMMTTSRSEWGPITTSKAWRPDAPEPHEADDFEDLGVCTSSLEWIEQGARDMGLVPEWSEHTMSMRCTPEQRERLIELSGVMSDTDFWDRIRSLVTGTPRWVHEFMDRIRG